MRPSAVAMYERCSRRMRRERVRLRAPTISSRASLLLIGLLPISALHAQPVEIRPSLRLVATATDNGAFADGRDAEGDLILEASPRLRVAARGAQHRLSADVEVTALKYARDSQPDRVLPNGQILFQSVLIDRWASLDLSLDLDQTNSNPYAARVDGASSFNRINTARFGISPQIKHDFGSRLLLEGRSDNIWIRRRGSYSDSDPRRDSVLHQHMLRLEREPQPLGFATELSHQETQYSGGLDTVLKISGARAVVSYALDPQLTVGLLTGAERSQFALSENTESIYGARTKWSPTERTNLSLGLEKRFFGTGWDLELRHRSPVLSLYLRVLRQPTSQPASQLLSPGEGDVGALLDAALTTRHPDPDERARIVRDLVERLGLPERLSGPLEVFADYAQLEQSASLTASLLGRVTNVSFTAYGRTYRQLARGEDQLSLGGGDNRQRGGELSVTRRLNPGSTVHLALGVARIEGLASRAGEATTNLWARASFAYQLSAKASIDVGLRRQIVRSNVVGSAHEFGLFAGIVQQF